MPRFHVEIRVMPRATLLDPQGKAVEHALSELEFSGISDLRVGRAIKFDIESPDEGSAEQHAREMCDKLLANPITEDYSIATERL
jgi:phosphoribosylformylglycinamidine synthase PurS subunit